VLVNTPCWAFGGSQLPVSRGPDLHAMKVQNLNEDAYNRCQKTYE